MRKTHEVLRLRFDPKLEQRQIARGANLSQSTVHEYPNIYVGPRRRPLRAPARKLPDFSHIHKQLEEYKHVTLQLLWGRVHTDASRRLPLQSVLSPLPARATPAGRVMRQQHRPGEKLFVDWAGDKVSVHEPIDKTR